jgi:hypothetical protein
VRHLPLLAGLLASLALAAQQPPDQAAALAAELRDAALDPATCVRIRDVTFVREDIRLYFDQGHLIFAKPIAGKRLFAVFTATGEGDSAEVLLRPPDRGERMSLAAATGSPNLSERFRGALFIFTDGGAAELAELIQASPGTREAPEQGVLLAGQWDSVVRNIGTSFTVRLVLDLLTGADKERGLFYAALAGTRLGNFDVLHDPLLREPVVAGQVSTLPGGPGFEVWASFASRSIRQGRQPVREQIELRDYRIEATIQPDLHLQAVTRVKVVPKTRLRGAVPFELAPQMDLTAVSIDGAPAGLLRRDSLRGRLVRNSMNEPFLVCLPAELAAGQVYEFEFQHAGQLILPAGNNVFFVAARTNWYPSHGIGFATYDLRFRLPRQLDLVSTGELVEDRVEGEWRHVHRRTPLAVRLAGFNLGEYQKSTVSRAGFTVDVYANRAVEIALQRPALTRPPLRRPSELLQLPPPPPPDPAARLSALANEIAGALEWMSAQFGPPPVKTLTVSPIPGFFGQGFPGLLYLSTLAFVDPADRPMGTRSTSQQLFYSEILHAHETAHQWWGNLVGSATYHDDWLQEALANYTALLVLERKKGAGALAQVLAEYRNDLRLNWVDGKLAESAGPITWGLRLRDPQAQFDPWRIITYSKGSWIIHMLRRRLGDDAFLAMLRELRNRFEYRHISTLEFREFAAAYQPKDVPDPKLESFFENWVYATGLPVLSMRTAVKGKAPAVQLTVTVTQSGVGEDFTADVPVEIRPPGGARPIVRWVRTSSEPAVFTVTLRAAPSKVELAPGDSVLMVRQ